VRAEAAGKQRDGVGFLHEQQLPCEEIFEGDQLGIIRDDRIRALLERQHDVDAEAALPPGPLLAGPHDPVGPTGDHHVPSPGQEPSESVRQLIIGIIGRRPGRTEQADFGPVAVRVEDFECVAKFFQRPIQDLDVERIQVGVMQLEDPQQHLLQEHLLRIVIGPAQHGLDLLEEFLVRQRRSAGHSSLSWAFDVC